MYVGLHIKYPLFLSDFNKTLIFSTDFRKLLKYQNPSSGNRVPCGWTDRQTEDGKTDMTKLTVAFCNFANAPKNVSISANNRPIHL